MVDPAPFMEALVGKPVSHVWQGMGSAIFIEFGQLTTRQRRDGEPGQLYGELTLMIKWSWRFERNYSILGGSWSSPRRWPGMYRKLIGSTVSKVEIFGYLPEIVVSLSNGLRIVSFMTAESQPEWTVLTRNPFIGHLCVKRGRLFIDERM